jgi:hypothetical protein
MKEETNLDVRILSLLFDEPYYYHGRLIFVNQLKVRPVMELNRNRQVITVSLQRGGSTCAVMPIGTPCWSMTPLYIFPYNAFGENWFI